MPIKFRCIACGQFLGIARRKAGTVVNCPRCRHPLTVPTEEQAMNPVVSAAPLLEAKDFDKWISRPEPVRTAGAVLPSRTVDVAEAQAEVVPEPQWPGPAVEPLPASPTVTPVERPATVSVRLLIVFSIVIAAVAFTIGILVGRFALPARSAGEEEPKVAPGKPARPNRGAPAVEPKQPPPNATGLVQCRVDGKTQPDVGARVLIFPTEPAAERIVSRGLRVEEQASNDRSGHERLLAFGGRFAVIDAAGRFQLELPRPGSYHVLIISATMTRDKDKEIYAADLATLRRLFADPDELLGDRDFLLITRAFRAGQTETIPYTFIGSVRSS
jgi:DNA-directed RNA polymerase subunit RPC12/RpoP